MSADPERPLGAVLYVLPYARYFSRRGDRVGGHIAHAVGILDAMRRAGAQVEVLSDVAVPGYAPAQVRHVPLAGARLREGLRRARRALAPTALAGAEVEAAAPGPAGAGLGGRARVQLMRGLFLGGLAWTTLRRARLRRPDLIYVRHTRDAFVPVAAARLLGVPVVVEVNTPASLRDLSSLPTARRSWSEPQRSWRERIQYEWADLTLVVSPALRGWIEATYGPEAAARVAVVPNGVDAERFAPATPDPDLRARLGAGPDDVLVGVAAAFVWYNAVDQLLDALQAARRRAPRLRLVLFGETSRGPELAAQVAARGLDEAVTIAGRIPFEAMPRHLAACDVLLSYFDFQGVPPHICSIKHLEYMASGRAVVAAAAGHANFAIDAGASGLLVEQGDVGGLTNALVRLAEQPELRRRLGERARQDAVRLHGWSSRLAAIRAALERSGADGADGWGTRPWFEAQLSGVDAAEGDAWGHRWRASQRLRHAALEETLAPLLRGAESVLDVGCAAGDLTRLLAASEPGRLVAVDVAGEGLRRTRQVAATARFAQAALPRLPFAGGAFDLVVAAEVVYYLPQEARERAFDELKRVLRPGGHLVFTSAVDDGSRYFTEAAAVHALRRRLQVVAVLQHRGRLLARVEAPLVRLSGVCGRLAAGARPRGGGGTLRRLGALAMGELQGRPAGRWLRRGAGAVGAAARRLAGSEAAGQLLLGVSRRAPFAASPTHVFVVARKA